MPFASLTLPALGPVLPRAKLSEALRGALGATLGLLATHAVLWLLGRVLGQTDAGFLAHPVLIAPLAASAVLIFAVPASPLAQPWSVAVGNTLAALTGLVVLQAGFAPLITLALAIFVALCVMALARCLHPPAGAVAMATVLAAPAGLGASLAWAGLTVGLGSVLLVASGVLFHQATGRRYPFGGAVAAPQPAPQPEPAAEPPSPMVLAAALARLRLEGTLGVDDLSRLIATAEMMAPHHRLTAAEIMTPDPATLTPQADWREMSALFVARGCRNLPVVDGLNRLVGLVPLQVILRPGAQGLAARHLMQTEVATAEPQTPIEALLPPLVQGGQTCLPVLDQDGSLTGIITRSDLLSALVHATGRGETRALDV